MPRLDWMKRELERLKKRFGVGLSILHFPNGTTRAIKTSRARQQRLELLIAAMDVARHSPPPGYPVPEQPRKISKFEPILQMFARAVSVSTDNSRKLIALVHDLCKQARDNEAKRGASEVEKARGASDEMH